MIPIFFLFGLAILPATYLLWLWKQQKHYSLWECCLYALSQLIVRLQWRTHVTGKEHLEGLPQGAILVANHRSSIDPFLIQTAAGRRVHWMVAGEYCRHFVFGPILRILEVIPTNRGGIDTASVKRALQHLQNGKFIGMFPEGRINRTSEPLLSIRPGVSLICKKTAAPVVPIWIQGAPQAPTVIGPLFRMAAVRVFIGKPIWMGEEDRAQHATRIGRQICSLGGHVDFAVELAGAKWNTD